MNPYRRAGRHKKINIYAHADGKTMPLLSIQCFEGRHGECNGICQALFFRGGKPCECSCHHKEKEEV